MTPIASPKIFVRFFYSQGGEQKKFKGLLSSVQTLLLDPSTLLNKVLVEKRFPDGMKISVFTPKMPLDELVILSEYKEPISPEIKEIPLQQSLPAQDPLTPWKVARVAALVLLNCVIWA